MLFFSHVLPDSPPDSGSEHPYSPQESCDQPINQEIIYTTLGNSTHLYKTDSSILSPILADNLILSGSIVVPTHRHQSLLEENRLIVQNPGDAPAPTDPRLLVPNQDERLMTNLTHLDGLTDGRHMIITTPDTTENNRIIIQPGNTSQSIQKNIFNFNICNFFYNFR